MSTNIVYQGAVAPEAFRLKVIQGASGIDLTTVTAIVFKVRPPNGVLMTWAAAISSGATTTTLQAVHTFSAPDTAQLGRHVLVAHLTLASGTVRTVPATLQVVDPMQVGA